jgi:hypothetical protein
MAGNGQYNAYQYEPREGGILRGKPVIAEYCGISPRTVDKWFRKDGFPMGKLPNGQWVSSVSLIDSWILARGILWLKNRLEHRPKSSSTWNVSTGGLWAQINGTMVDESVRAKDLAEYAEMQE